MDLLNANFWTTFLTLACLEIVLGVDNIIFHSLTIAKLPRQLQQKARLMGMGCALGCRFLLLWALVWVMSLTHGTVGSAHESFSSRDLVLLLGGAFLAVKSVLELCKQPEDLTPRKLPNAKCGMVGCIAQIAILDIIFSLDSVITAVGMANDLRIIMLSIVAAMVVMTCFSAKVSEFLSAHSRIRALAFLFIAFIGGAFVLEAIGVAVPKIYIYGLTALALGVELMRLRLVKKVLWPVRAVQKNLQPRIKFDEPHAAHDEISPVSQMAPNLQNYNCSNCDMLHTGYAFCVQCGAGLGLVSIRLGDVQYETA